MPSELTLCAMTLQRAPIGQRVSAAAGAGFDSIGLSLEQYRRSRAAGTTDEDLADLLDEHGLTLAELEAPWDWAADDAPARREGDELFRVLDRFGCGQLNAVQFGSHPTALLVDRFGALCERAAAFGVVVALEFMPFSSLPTLADACALVDEAAHPAGGLLLDCWHHDRAPGSAETLAATDPARILSVQLNDPLPTPEPDARAEARHRRQLPGPRSVALLRTLRDMGCGARSSVEVWSDDLESHPPGEAAHAAACAARDVIAAARRQE